MRGPQTHLQSSHSHQAVLVVEEGWQDVEDGGPGLDQLLQLLCLEGDARDGREEHRLHLVVAQLIGGLVGCN